MRTFLLAGAGALALGLSAGCKTTKAMSDGPGDRASMAGAMSGGSMDVTMVGGAEMFPYRNIIENTVNSADHTTLVAAVKAAGLVETLSGAGPFTVFAPTNDAFAALPPGTVETLLKPENKGQLVKILTAHVVAGDLKSGDLMGRAAGMGGKAALTTLSGDALVFKAGGGKAFVLDENGGKAEITIADVDQSNGVIHVVNSVLLPK